MVWASPARYHAAEILYVDCDKCAEKAEVAEVERRINEITESVIGAAIAVHRELGPGLLESAYDACLAYELNEKGLKVERQKNLPLIYRGVQLDCGYRLDFLVEDRVVVEVKAVDKLEPIHEAQIISYLKLSGCKAGLLINFKAKILKHGIRRFVNEFSG